MNPEELGLPQPPEGILDAQKPWHLPMPKSPGLWGTLKARLTGRPNEYGNYSSYVNITEADADRLIANMKKDPRGYPQLDQSSGTPSQWMDRQRIYQEWLVAEYLENPFREDVNKKIEETEQQRRLQEIQEQKRKEKEEREKKKKEKEQIKPPEPLTPMVPEPASVQEEPQQEPPQPEASPEAQPETVPIPSTDNVPTQVPLDVIPLKFPNASRQKVVELSAILDNIAAELSSQIVIVNRRKSILRTSNQGLKLAQFLVGQQIENYTEFLNDLETQSREEETDLGLDIPDTDPPEKKPVPKISEPKPETPPKKQWWEVWKPSTDSKPQSPRKASAGLMSTSMPAMAEGGISTGTGLKNIIQPGIYDNPTVGNLAPGTAVVPLNRNYGKDMFGDYDEIEYMNALGEVMGLPMKGLLGSVLSVYGSILSSLGPLAGYFNKSLPSLLQGASSILGISFNSVLNMLGGPAYAGATPNEKEEKYFYKSWRIYMDKNRLYFPGAGGVFGGGSPTGEGELAEDILTIGEKGEGLSMMGGTNVGKAPAWIPFPKSAAGKLEYSSGFGYRWGRQHGGIDLAGDPGIKIITPFAGEVFDINRNWPQEGAGGYGNLVGIKHEKPPVFTFYGHLQEVAKHLQIGTKVKAGEVIGTLGNTGRSTGPHLHWEVRTSQNGGQIDPVEWTHQNKPSFSIGGWLKMATNIASKFIKPKGLSVKGVQAGFTGMSKAGFDAIMGGAKFRNPNKASLVGKGSRPVLGHGAYSAPTAKGASRYMKPGGGIVKSIVPGGARGIKIIEPQSVVKPATFDKGKLLADKLLKGAYSNSRLANKLRTQLITGAAQSTGIGLGKIFSKFVPLLNAPVIGDMLFPESTASYDQLTGPNAYYNAPGYKKSSGKPMPVATTPVATKSKPSAKVTTIQMPSQTAPNVVSKPSSSMTFVNLGMETNKVMEMEMLRRVQ
jgi:murein DD-endopeptidase MepM/ murein hydrolase activator NlpD